MIGPTSGVASDLASIVGLVGGSVFVVSPQEIRDVIDYKFDGSTMMTKKKVTLKQCVLKELQDCCFITLSVKERQEMNGGLPM